ncbi:hypothetical protein Tco_0591350 [Tanacetum coccineum]
MFDRAFKRVNTFEDFRIELVEGKEKRAGTDLAQEVTKKQKVEDDKETTEFKKLMEIILDEEESTFLEDATYADLYVGREEVSSYTIYTYNDVRKEALLR